MIALVMLFLCLCTAAVLVERVRVIHALGFRLNVWLLIFSAGILISWWIVRFTMPLTGMTEQTWMVYISLAGFLSMLLSFTVAIRSLEGTRFGIVAGLSLIMALIHFFDMVVSIPFS